MSKTPKLIPSFASEAEERAFWETHDSTEYVDWSHAQKVRLPNLKPTSTSISLRLPQTLLERIKVAANKRDIPYQSLIKAWLAEKIDTQLMGDAVHSAAKTRGKGTRPINLKR